MRHWQVYVMTSEAGAVKVGVSKSPERRAAGVSTQGFGDAALAFATEVPFFGHWIERRAHALLAQHRLKGEWFSVSAEEAERAIHQAIDDHRHYIATKGWKKPARPSPPEPHRCYALHPMTCAGVRGEAEPCRCECHNQWGPFDD